MKLITKTICSVALVAASMQVAIASDTTWDFNSNNNAMDYSYNTSYNTYAYYGNNLSDSQNGQTIKVTGYSDTYERQGDDLIQSTFVMNNSYGLLSYNQNGGYDEEHTTDNIGNRNDTDMLFFEFSDAVSLTSLEMGWVESDSDISIAAFSSMPTLSGSTWSDVASNAVFTTSFSDVGSGILNLSSIVTEAKYWLIGAYHRAFGGENWSDNNDGFKLLALTTHLQDEPPSDVPAPATALMAALMGLVLYRRRKA